MEERASGGIDDADECSALEQKERYHEPQAVMLNRLCFFHSNEKHRSIEATKQTSETRVVLLYGSSQFIHFSRQGKAQRRNGSLP